jgi:hypothetical protein
MEPILEREKVTDAARDAARLFATNRGPDTNPHPVGSDAAAAWQAAFQRYLLLYTAPEAEGSA